MYLGFNSRSSPPLPRKPGHAREERRGGTVDVRRARPQATTPAEAEVLVERAG